MHEMKRMCRGAAELLAIAEDLRHHDIQLELLTGPLQGVYAPFGRGADPFAFFAGIAESEREYIREKSLEGQACARERGRHGGHPKVVDHDIAAYARSLRAPSGRGTVHRAVTDAEEAGMPVRSTPAAQSTVSP
ncbi:recombinase family protein [Streptomyces sp. NPDC048349]|uniref:recombinase family protein n=1 Tax=Streptomyces sp. NPDC048349 TaxID=3155486 RepID=UPI003425CBB1